MCSPSMTDATDMFVPAMTLRKFSLKYLSLTVWAKDPRASTLISENVCIAQRFI